MRWASVVMLLHLWANVDAASSLNACSKLPDVAHALVSDYGRKDEYPVGAVIHFTCETGYLSEGTLGYVCTSKGWLAVQQGMCYSCSTLPRVPHAYVSEETSKFDYRLGDVIRFTCEGGFISTLTTSYVCASGGWLALHQGTCYSPASRCELPPANGGFRVAGLPGNDTLVFPHHILTFSCDDGKYLSGSSVLVCGTDGQWSSPFPTCEEKCIVPEIPSNMRMSPEVHRGSQVNKGEKIQFQCASQQHAIKGSAEVECLDQGRWSTAFPTCAIPPGPQSCGNAPSLADGDIEGPQKNSYLHGEKVKYMCQPYYILEGDPHNRCNNGQWIGTVRCLRPCSVNKDAMNAHSIMFKHYGDDRLYATHGDYISFSCSGRARHDGRLDMRQQCINGVINLPTCI